MLRCIAIIALVLLSAAEPVSAQWPLASTELRMRNPRIGELWWARSNAPFDSYSFHLLSSHAPNGGSTIVGLQTSLQADWSILSQIYTGQSTGHMLQMNLPAQPSWVGLDLTLQSILYRPTTGELVATNPVTGRIAPATNGQRILIVRQTVANAEAPYSATQASGLASSLIARGHQVVMVDDMLPPPPGDYDVVLDCRFTTVPMAQEAEYAKGYLRAGTGVFFLAGPWAASAAGQARVAFLQQFLTGTCGMPVIIASGLGQSVGPNERVDPRADPGFLSTPHAISSLPYDVDREGGNFGPVGFSTTGRPMVTGLVGNLEYTYGLLWESGEIQGFQSAGSLAVLLNGSQWALGSNALTNPYAEDLFENLVNWLDV